MMASLFGNRKVHDFRMATVGNNYGEDNILQLACLVGNVGMVRHIISQNIVSIESKGTNGMTPIMYAAGKGHMAVFKLLVEEGADVSVVDDDGNNNLHAACFVGNVDMVRHIISLNIVSIDSKGLYGNTPVMYAAQEGDMDVFELLVKEGADLSVVADHGTNILHAACKGGNVDIVKNIISQNIVSIESKGTDARTPVTFTVWHEHLDVFKLLVIEGADLSVVDDYGNNVLHLACGCGTADMVNHIISQKIVSIDSKGYYGRTPVMSAAVKGDVAIYMLLVREGADLSVVDDYGANILHLACLGGSVDIMTHVISQDIVSIESKGEHGRIPAMYAAEGGDVTIFKMLMKEGADVSVEDDKGNNILHLACGCGKADMVMYIISQSIVSIDSKGQDGRTPLMWAAQKGDMDIYELLVTEGADVSIVDDDSNNILHLACFVGTADMVKHIISQNIVSVESKGQDGRTPVMYAAEGGDITIFKMLLKEGADVSVVDDNCDTILHVACAFGHMDIVKCIISQNIVSIERKGRFGMTPVMCAAVKGNMDVFKVLVTEGADLSVVNDDGANILHLACFGGNVDMVRHIISQNLVSIEGKAKNGHTPVVYAAENGHMGVFKVLVTEGADVSVVDGDGNNILHLACKAGDVDIVKHIISQNIFSIAGKAQNGRTPVMCAAGNGHMGVFKMLVTEGADVSEVDDDGNNILHLACLDGSLEMVKHIISQNIVSIESKGQDGRTPLMYACNLIHTDVFKLLIRDGADVSVVDDEGNNILHIACGHGKAVIVKHIISQNIVSINSRGHIGGTPLMYAAQKGHMDVFELVVKEGADVSVVNDDGTNILHLASLGASLDVVKHIISQNLVSIDSKEKQDLTPLMIAAIEGHIDVFKLLVTKGADVSVVDDSGSNILHLACLGGNVNIVKRIISQNIVSLDSKGKRGLTSMMCAAMKGHIDVFKLIVTKGADVSVVDDSGNNILHAACFGGNLDIVKHILSHNLVSIESTDQNGMTPVMYAAENGHMDVVALLIIEGADVSVLIARAFHYM